MKNLRCVTLAACVKQNRGKRQLPDAGVARRGLRAVRVAAAGARRGCTPFMTSSGLEFSFSRLCPKTPASNVCALRQHSTHAVYVSSIRYLM